MTYKKEGLKSKLLKYLIVNKFLYRRDMKELAKKWKVEPDTCTRRLRELVEDFPIQTLNYELLPCDMSEHIVAWKLTKKIKPTTILNSK